MRHLVRVCALLGSLLGVGNAALALVVVGSNLAYQNRLSAGLVALLAAVLTGVGGLVAGTHPARGAGIILLNGAMGAVAINLFYINTFSLLAVPL